MDSSRRIAPNILAPFTLRHHARTLTATPAGLIREQSQGRCDNGHIEDVTPDEGAAPQRFVFRLTRWHFYREADGVRKLAEDLNTVETRYVGLERQIIPCGPDHSGVCAS